MSVVLSLAVLAAFLGDPSPDEERAADLRALLEPLRSPAAPGGILAVLRRGVQSFAEPFGQADLEHGRPVDRATRFYVASVAKAFTATCVLAAAEAGELELDASIRRSLPGLPESFEAVTPRMLLHHRAGVRDVYELAIGLDLGSEALRSNTTALELIARAGGPDSIPGRSFRYSNSGYVLLAEALRANGQDLPARAHRLVFEPLGMRGARFTGEPEGEAPSARGYERRDGGWAPVELESGLVGPGGLWLGLDDITRWERAAFEGGFGTERLRAALCEPPRLGPAQSEHPAFGHYAAGVMVGADRGLAVVRCAGQAFGFSSEILRYPEQEVSVVLLSNGDLDLDDLCERAAGLVLAEELAAVERPQPYRGEGPDPARLGRFWIDESGVLWIASARPGRATLASLDGWKLELEPAGPSRLVARGARLPVAVELEPEDGPARSLLVSVDRKPVARCRPLRPEPLDPREFEGEYELPELGARLRLVARGSALAIDQRRVFAGFVLPPFQPLGEDVFACDAGAQMRFRRDENGRVIELVLDLNRARGLVLQRL